MYEHQQILGVCHRMSPTLLAPWGPNAFLSRCPTEATGFVPSSYPCDPACQHCRKIKCVSLPCKPDNCWAFLEAISSQRRKDRCYQEVAAHSVSDARHFQYMRCIYMYSDFSKGHQKICHCWKRAAFPTCLAQSHRDQTLHVMWLAIKTKEKNEHVM